MDFWSVFCFPSSKLTAKRRYKLCSGAYQCHKCYSTCYWPSGVYRGDSLSFLCRYVPYICFCRNLDRNPIVSFRGRLRRKFWLCLALFMLQGTGECFSVLCTISTLAYKGEFGRVPPGMSASIKTEV